VLRRTNNTLVTLAGVLASNVTDLSGLGHPDYPIVTPDAQQKSSHISAREIPTGSLLYGSQPG